MNYWVRKEADRACGRRRRSPPQTISCTPRARSPLTASRVFFESFDALVPRDNNDAQDVYEWERAAGEGKAGREECAQSGADLYALASGGCLSLISSGESAADSAVPRRLRRRLATSSSPPRRACCSQDPGQIDIYDARVGGGFPPPDPPRPPCEGEACQSPPARPDDPTPASSAFAGPGDRCRDTRAHCAKGKHRVTQHGKARCVKKQKRRHTRNRRAGTMRRALLGPHRGGVLAASRRPGQRRLRPSKKLDLTFTRIRRLARRWQAGSHPFAMTTTLAVNTVEEPSPGEEVPDGEAQGL